MKRKLAACFPYLAAFLCAQYGLPLLAGNTGSALLILLGLLPSISLLCGFFFGTRHGLSMGFPLLSIVFLIPALWVYMNATAWLYPLVFGLLVFIGDFMGSFIFRRRNDGA